MVVVRRRWFQAPWEFRESAVFTAIAVGDICNLGNGYSAYPVHEDYFLDRQDFH